jgi:hypothetical protein
VRHRRRDSSPGVDGRIYWPALLRRRFRMNGVTLLGELLDPGDDVRLRERRCMALIRHHDRQVSRASLAVHVVERYRLVDREAAKGTLERAAKELWRPGGPFAPNYADKYLQVDFTIEDEGTFTTPWTASVSYARDRLEWPEISCAENPAGFHNDKDIGIPHADKADF